MGIYNYESKLKKVSSKTIYKYIRIKPMELLVSIKFLFLRSLMIYNLDDNFLAPVLNTSKKPNFQARKYFRLIYKKSGF